MSNMKTSTGIEIKECFACKLPFPITYLQTLVFDHLSMNFWFNCMPDNKKKSIRMRSESRSHSVNRNNCTYTEIYFEGTVLINILE